MKLFFVTYVFPDGETRDRFYAELAENRIQELCEAEDGCLSYRYFRPCDSETELFLLEKWTDAEKQTAHTKTPHFALVAAMKKRYGIESRVEWTETV